MALLRRVRGFIRDEKFVYECRRCGTTLEADIDVCPHCGKRDIAVYDLG